jgi:hypothetical protein
VGGLIDQRVGSVQPSWVEAYFLLYDHELKALGCSKAGDQFFIDWVDRNPAIGGAVKLAHYHKSRLPDGTIGHRFRSFFQRYTDAANVAHGMPLMWLDATTQISCLRAGNAYHLVLHVGARNASLPTHAQTVMASLLV